MNSHCGLLCRVAAIFLVFRLNFSLAQNGYFYPQPDQPLTTWPEDNPAAVGYEYPKPNRNFVVEESIAGTAGNGLEDLQPLPAMEDFIDYQQGQMPAEGFLGDFMPIQEDEPAQPPAVVLSDPIDAEVEQPSQPPAGVLSDPIDAEVEQPSQPPKGVMDDFIDDLIEGHKQQIVASILGISPASSNVNGIISVSGGSAVPNPDDSDSKAYLFNKCAACSCGVPNVNRIIGGKQVRFNKYPWIAQLLLGDDTVFCGGALINDRYVLTAAHCIHGMNLKSIRVHLLQADRLSEFDSGITRGIYSAMMHSGYDTVTLEHDIALIQLDEVIPLLDPIRPVCLPTSLKQNFDMKSGTVAGWGVTKQDGYTSDVLREVSVPIITNAQCKKTEYKSMITETMLCAGYLGKGGMDACQGDSGGPLIVKDRIFQLAGVVSFGYGCARPNAPGVYTRVSRYLPWISMHTRDSCYCTS